MSFGTDNLNYMAGHLDTFTAEVYHVLMGSWPAQTIVTLYIVIVGYAILKGHAGVHAKELGISMVLLLVLQGVVISGFSYWIADPILHLTQALGQVAVDASGARGGDVFQSLDDGLGQVMHAVDTIQPTGNFLTNAWLFLKVGAASFVMAIAFGLMYVAFMALYLMAIFSIYMMLMVGGVFVWLGAFKAFRPLTWAWIRAVMNYVLWVFFLSAVAGFFMNVVTATVTDMAQWDLAVDGALPPSLGKMVFFSVLVTYLLLKTADWSSALTGGTSMSPGIVTSGFSVASRAAGSVGAPGGRAAMGAAGRMGGAAWGAARGGAARAFSALKGLK
jgi:type IV secretory pathway VirB6-like protein